MSDATRQQLQRAYELIKAKQRQEAVNILLPILKADENNVNAWWLLANAVTDPNDVREALETVLRLRPDHANAQKMLDDHNRRYPPPSPQAADESFDFGGSGSDFFSAAEASLPPSASDPFGAPAQPIGRSSSSDPFGSAQPFGVPSGSQARSADPFGAAPAPRTSGASGYVGAPSSTVRKPTASGGSNRTLVIILAVIGGIAVCACLACFVVSTVLPAAGIALLGASGNQIIDLAQGLATQTYGTLQAGGFNLGDGSTLPASAIGRGAINYGDSRRDTLSQGQQHTYTFNGTAGETVVIDLLDTNGSTDPYVALYGPDSRQLASDDDGGDVSFDSRLVFALPSSGTYTILARTFADSGGSYELRLNRR